MEKREERQREFGDFIKSDWYLPQLLGSSAEHHHLEISHWDYLSKTLFDKEFDKEIEIFQNLWKAECEV